MSAVDRVRRAYARIAEVNRPEIWIGLRPREDVEAEAAAVDPASPLAGTVFAVKGNIDVAGLPTTAGCPSYAYHPGRDAEVVARLRAAGAVVLGTTNLDQFATGLVGTRSPYGAVRNAVDPAYVSGGSSSGSAVAVALGIADFALGTDTAGSGRVPAAFNGIVGVKPTYGLVPTDGVVPACRSLDCVTVFARTLAEARRAFAVMTSEPPSGVSAGSSVSPGAGPWGSRRPGPWRVAVPPAGALGELDPGWGEAFERAARSLRDVELVPIDPAPFLEAADLLYQGAFVAERHTAVGEFVAKGGPGLDPTVAGIITAAATLPAHRLFADQERLALLRAQAMARLGDADALLLPTTPGHPTIAEVAEQPLAANTRLGRFTNSTNLFGLSALAVPAGEVGGRPFGVMLLGRAHADDLLAAIAERLSPPLLLAVVGAHLSGQPLNHQLTSHGARLAATTATAPHYRLYALATDPPKPGLVRAADGGAAIEVEVWELPAQGLGRLLAQVPRPLALGEVELSDGGSVTGFVCTPEGLGGAAEITAHGGWRAYLASGRR
ncbi:allophanate hydrolase [Nonomuraea soli]|uniref:Allophanate hydrolase n=1 Tax=Nonomuraea soli TaxID=1032476 RepID=A0A7W0CGT8_9ACTN|nr:allophanate hydrolase [Nonomuraea soli]MBA2890910.1 allophanate hydrolase [Nonomuraea soli]